MKTRIISVLVMVLGFTLSAVITAVPAHAEDGQYAARYCVAYDGSLGFIRRKETCAQVRWNEQRDGSGVVLEFLDVDTVDGASVLDGYTDVQASFANSSVIKGQWHWGVEPDNFTKNHDSIRGADETWMIYRLSMCGGNDRLWWSIRLYGGGNDDLIDKGHEEDGTCGGGGGD